MQLFHETAKAQGLDDTQTTYATGWCSPTYMVEILKDAATYEGGLDRGNIALAARHMDVVNPLVFEGVVQQTNGFEDAYLNEAGQMNVYEVRAGCARRFVQAGELIDNNGAIGTYDDFLAAAGG